MNKNFKIIGDLNYINEIEEKSKKIFDFFNINKLDNGIVIKVYDDINSFKAYLQPYLNCEYQDYMIMSTHDGNINILSLEQCKKTKEHSEITKDEYINYITHEIVHICQSIVKESKLNENIWFYEALATNLVNNYQLVHINNTLETLNENFHTINKNYHMAYTIGHYIFANYTKEQILNMCKDESLINIDINKVNEYVESKVMSEYQLNSINNLLNKYNLIKYNNHYFHGSPKLLEQINKQQSHDSNNNEVNIDNAIFLTNSVLLASAYSFKDTIKENSEKYNFDISSNIQIPIMTMEDVIIDETLKGYIYVFEKNEKIINEPLGSNQYKSYEDLVPKDIIKIKYSDFSFLYEIKENIKQKGK